jgi:hypothetical protein
MDLIRTIAAPFCSLADMPLRPHVTADPSGDKAIAARRPRTAERSTGNSQQVLSPGEAGYGKVSQAGGAAGGTVRAAPASTTGMDYLEYLGGSLASTVAFTDR